MATGRRIRVGIIGYGYAGEVIHAPLIKSVPDLELVAVSTSRADRRELAESRGLRAFERAEELIGADDIDLVVVATPHDSHLTLTDAAAAAGKHVVCDKLMARTVAEAEQMVVSAEQAGVMLSIFHNRRWDGDFLMARDVIASAAAPGEETVGGAADVPAVGRLISVFAWVHSPGAPAPQKWRAQKTRGGGIFSDWGAHLMDQALLLHSGEPELLCCTMQYAVPEIDVETAAHAIFRFGDGSIHHIETNQLFHEASKGYEIWGTEGRLLITGFDPKENELNVAVRGTERRAPEYRVRWYSATDPESPRELYPPPAGDWAAFYRSIAAHLVSGEPLAVPGADILRMMRLRRAAIAAAQ